MPDTEHGRYKANEGIIPRFFGGNSASKYYNELKCEEQN